MRYIEKIKILPQNNDKMTDRLRQLERATEQLGSQMRDMRKDFKSNKSDGHSEMTLYFTKKLQVCVGLCDRLNEIS